MNCKIVPTTTLKNIKLYPENEINKPFLNKDLDNLNWIERFRYPDRIVLGSLLGTWRERNISPQHRYVKDGHNYAENKLTSVALPIMQYLQFEEIFLVGWDGKGWRWFDDEKFRKSHPYLKPSYGLGISSDRMFTYENLSYWVRWGKIVGYEIKSLMTDEETIINKWVDHTSFEDLFSGDE